MIEVYLFLAVFPVQILAVSVLYPLWFSRLVRKSLAINSAERLAELYPGVDVADAHERFLTRYRTANMVVAGLGLLLLGWFIIYMRRSDWEPGWVSALSNWYFMLQFFPIALMGWFTTRFNKLHRHSPQEGKRKALLQRRGLFDFVSPLTAALAVLSFLLFAALNFYVAKHPFAGYAGPFVNIGIVTLIFVSIAFVTYRVVYGKKTDPRQTHAERMAMISLVANSYALICIIIPMFLSLGFARRLLELETWGPFTGSLGCMAILLLSLRPMIALPRQPEADGPGSSPVHR